MHLSHFLPLLFSLATGALPSPNLSFHTTPLSSSLIPRTSTEPTALSILLTIAPSSTTCSSAPVPSECSTAANAAPYLISAMSAYNVTYPSELSALLSLIAYETANFQYNTNHFPAPGRPGQGTRNMQMAQYNLLYARSIPELTDSVNAITTSDSVDGLSDDELNAIRAVVLPDAYSWGSAAWFLTTQCGQDVRTALQTGGESGWEGYLGCVGTQATDDRKEVWERANQAFGITSS